MDVALLYVVLSLRSMVVPRPPPGAVVFRRESRLNSIETSDVTAGGMPLVGSCSGVAVPGWMTPEPLAG